MLLDIRGTSWTGKRPVATPLPTRTETREQTSIALVGFELTVPVFERSKTTHVMNSASTVISITVTFTSQCGETDGGGGRKGVAHAGKTISTYKVSIGKYE
jgi:hypothetical protein